MMTPDDYHKYFSCNSPIEYTTIIIAEMCNWLNGLKPNYKFILECYMFVNFTQLCLGVEK